MDSPDRWTDPLPRRVVIKRNGMWQHVTCACALNTLCGIHNDQRLADEAARSTP